MNVLYSPITFVGEKAENFFWLLGCPSFPPFSKKCCFCSTFRSVGRRLVKIGFMIDKMYYYRKRGRGCMMQAVQRVFTTNSLSPFIIRPCVARIFSFFSSSRIHGFPLDSREVCSCVTKIRKIFFHTFSSFFSLNRMVGIPGVSRWMRIVHGANGIHFSRRNTFIYLKI